MNKNITTAVFMSLLLGAGIPALTSCLGKTDEANRHHETTVAGETEGIEVIHAAYETPASFSNPFRQAAEHYLALKDALVKSEGEEAKQHAAALAASLNETDATALEGEAARKWESVEKALKTGASQIAATADLAEQRQTFTELSNNMITATEAFGAGNTLYRQYCPMANRDSGGSWLSSNKEVRNPYYGDAMLECGEVQAAIQDKE